MNKQKIKNKIEKLNKQLQEIEEKERLKKEKNKDKPVYTKIPELGIEISQQIYNNKTYSEILKLVKESQIADHNLLFKLRELTEKYPQFEAFWVFVPNPDKISKEKGAVARFNAYSDGADLYCDRNPSNRNSSLGVFLWRKIK